MSLKSQTIEPKLDNVKSNKNKKKRERGRWGEVYWEVSIPDQEFLTKQLDNKWGCGHSWESLISDI